VAELGLFPLPIVLVPTERIPLHIFEPRYLELITECYESDEEFGLVLATGDGAVHEVGTRAAVLELFELEDGRLNIVVEGRARFRLLELKGGRSFKTAVVEPVTDDPEFVEPATSNRALEVFRELAKEAESDVDVPPSDSELLDFELAARVDFGTDAKQELLASTSPRARMTRLVELLELSIEAIRRERKLRELAGRNGKVSSS
jgi:ATP-dependent Lon protease